MRKTQNKDIDGHDWLVTQFPAGEGIKLLTTLTRLIGPTIAGLAGDVKKPSDLANMKLDSKVLQIAVEQLASKLDEDNTLDLVKRLLAGTRKDGEEVVPTFDVAFQGEYLTLFKVLGFVLKVNYSSFFKGSDEQGSSEQQAQ